MMTDYEDLLEMFKETIGLEPFIDISRVQVDKERATTNIHLSICHGTQLRCPHCGKIAIWYDSRPRMWRHLDIMGRKTMLRMMLPRVKCSCRGGLVKNWEPSWALPRRRFTLPFELMAARLCASMPVSRAALEVGEYDSILWSILSIHTERARKKLDFSDVEAVGVDEASSKKGHKYITVFADIKSKAALFATPGKDASTVAEFKGEFTRNGGIVRNVSDFAMDMSKSFISGVGECFPNAKITFDKFHIIKVLSSAVDKTRRDEAKSEPVLKGARWQWLKSPADLTEKERQSVGSLKGMNIKTAKAYRLKCDMQDIFAKVDDPALASKAIELWISLAERSRLPGMINAAKTIKSHFAGIMRYFASKLTSGIMEAMSSNIQEVKRRARGFRNINNFITIIYLVCGDLDYGF